MAQCDKLEELDSPLNKFSPDDIDVVQIWRLIMAGVINFYHGDDLLITMKDSMHKPKCVVPKLLMAGTEELPRYLVYNFPQVLFSDHDLDLMHDKIIHELNHIMASSLESNWIGAQCQVNHDLRRTAAWIEDVMHKHDILELMKIFNPGTRNGRSYQCQHYIRYEDLKFEIICIAEGRIDPRHDYWTECNCPVGYLTYTLDEE